MPAHRKPTTMRQRRNRPKNAVLLPPEKNPIKRPPALPEHPSGEEWHSLVKVFWRDLWRSPQAAEYLRTDFYGLAVLAVLLDQFFKSPAPTASLSREIRALMRSFGLDPDDRRGLDWFVEDPEDKTVAVQKLPARTNGSDPRAIGFDPRDVLESGNN